MPKKNIKIERVGTMRLCVVEPGKVGAGDTANWQNKTGGEVIVYFPHDDVFTGVKDFKRKVEKDNDYETPAPADASKRGTYRYAIYCAATDTFAVGGSDPEIIVT